MLQYVAPCLRRCLKARPDLLEVVALAVALEAAAATATAAAAEAACDAICRAAREGLRDEPAQSGRSAPVKRRKPNDKKHSIPPPKPPPPPPPKPPKPPPPPPEEKRMPPPPLPPISASCVNSGGTGCPAPATNAHVATRGNELQRALQRRAATRCNNDRRNRLYSRGTHAPSISWMSARAWRASFDSMNVYAMPVAPARPVAVQQRVMHLDECGDCGHL
jgi:outer membrane biosynthesis protein TonB